MSEDEIKEKIELLKEFLEYGLEYKDYIQVVNAFEDLKKLIEKQDKMIDLMAEFIWKYDCCEHLKKEDDNFKCEGWYINRECRENCIKPYFRKKVEND